MISLAKKNNRIWKKITIIFFVCFIFSAGNRRGANLTYEQHILSAVTDHYYMTYFLLPYVLFCCFAFIEDDVESVICRFGRYSSYFWRKWLGTGLIAGEMILFQNAAILLSGAGLPGQDIWMLPEGALEEELFSVFGKYFSSPGQAFWVAVCFEFAGIWILNAVSMWVCHFTGRKWAVRIFMMLYVFSALWIKFPVLQFLPVTGWNHLLILHHNLTSSGRFSLTIATVIILTGVIYLTVRFSWRSGIGNIRGKRNGLMFWYFRELFSGKNRMIMFLVVTGITLYKGLQNPFPVSGEEWIYSLFYGHGTGYFRIFPFLEMLIVNGMPLYLLAVFTESSVSGQSLFLMIRLRNKRELMFDILVAGMGFIFFYSLLWGIAGLAGCSCFGYLLSKNSVQILINAALMKGLEIFLQYLLMITLYICTKQITAGFLVLLGGNILCILPMPLSAFLPFGLSSMARISVVSSYPGMEPMIAGGILLTGIVLTGSWLLLVGQKRVLI